MRKGRDQRALTTVTHHHEVTARREGKHGSRARWQRRRRHSRHEGGSRRSVAPATRPTTAPTPAAAAVAILAM